MAKSKDILGKFEIVLHDELKDYLPPLSAKEYEELKQSIKDNEGFFQPIIVSKIVSEDPKFEHLNRHYLIDGHNRIKAYAEVFPEYVTIEGNTVNINVDVFEFPIEKKTDWFTSLDDAKIAMLEMQVARRNLPKAKLAELGLKKAALLEQRARENQLSGLKKGDSTPVNQKSDKRETVDTLKEAADFAGVSRDTVSKVKKVLSSDDEEVKEDMRTGRVSINKAYNTIAPRAEHEPVISPVSYDDAEDITPELEEEEEEEQPQVDAFMDAFNRSIDNATESIMVYVDIILGKVKDKNIEHSVINNVIKKLRSMSIEMNREA